MRDSAGFGSKVNFAGRGPISSSKSEEYRIQPEPISALNTISTSSPGFACAGTSATCQRRVCPPDCSPDSLATVEKPDAVELSARGTSAAGATAAASSRATETPSPRVRIPHAPAPITPPRPLTVIPLIRLNSPWQSCRRNPSPHRKAPRSGASDRTDPARR